MARHARRAPTGRRVLVGVVSLVVIFGLRAVAPRVPGALVLVVGGLLASRLFDLGAHGVALGGQRAERAPESRSADSGAVQRPRGTIALAAVALVLIGFSQTAGDARTFAAASLSHRHRPGVGRPGHVQRRCRSVPGDAGLDQPLCEFAERSLGSAHRPRVADVRRDRPAHASRARAAVLGPAEARSRRRDHRGRGDGDDGRARDAPPAPGSSASTSGSRSRRSPGRWCSGSSPG